MTSITPELKAAIHQAVQARRNDIVDMLLEIVGVESITHNDGGVQDAIEQIYMRRGLEVVRW